MSSPFEFGATPLPACACPRCGAPNACAPAAAGRFDVPCWCAEIRVDPARLAGLPPEARGRACLCRRCLTGEAAQITSAHGDAGRTRSD